MITAIGFCMIALGLYLIATSSERMWAILVGLLIAGIGSGILTAVAK